MSVVSKQAAARARVLVADDSEEQRLLLTAFVRDIDADFDFVADGEEVVDAYKLARAEGRAYDLLILDVVMPKLSGLGAAEIIRNELEDKTTPIRFLTAETNVTSVTQTRAAFAEGEIWLKDQQHSADAATFEDTLQWSKLDVSSLKENIASELRRVREKQ